MSKFAEKLQRIYKGSAPVLGFRKTDGDPLSQLLVVASLVGSGAKASKTAAGADAIIVDNERLNREGLEQLSAAVGGIPLGVSLEGDKQENAEIDVSVCDFVVFDVKTPLVRVSQEGIGKVLKIQPSLDIGLIRAINELPISVDGVLLVGESFSITVERLLICRRFADLLDIPLLVTVGPSLSSNELSGLCQAGVKGVVLSEWLTAKALAEIKKAVSCLPNQTKRKARSVPVLPRIHPENEAVEEQEDEEEDI